MSGETWIKLDQHLRLRLADLPAKLFEDFFLHFLNSGVSLTVQRHGGKLTRKVITASSYAGEGQDQKGIDLTVQVEGPEEWCFQCKRQKTWSRSQTLTAIQEAKRYQAQHYFLAVACDPGADVHDEMKNHPNWTFWNLDKICEEFRLQVPPTSQVKCLFFLDPSEIKRFVPFSTEALVSPEEFFSRFRGSDKLFRHDWKLVGREEEMHALEEFVRGGSEKALLLVSKGGDGKSRLLWEFTRDIQVRFPGAQALFLNPHSRDEPAFAFLGETTKRVVVIDDAHRLEQVPLDLLSLARKDPTAKIILATRPQAISALASKLFEAGMQDSHRTVSLKTLKRNATRALATEALGEALAEHAQALADLTADCPFLTVLAGGLLRQGRLTWGQWASHSEFRQHVFRAFEEENLRGISEQDRELARGLLRIIAMLAPIPAGTDLVGRSARCLGSSVPAVETQLQRLRAAELVIGRDDGLRIVPDLFADFLVYSTCCDSASKMPTFARQVIEEFSACAPAALRNLAEAAWVAHANGVSDDRLIRALVEAETRRFEASSFYDRAAVLEHWKTFSVFLPRESLALARTAIALTDAPCKHPTSEWWGDVKERIDSHRAVLDELPALLGPIAQYHDEPRAAALELLWGLGLQRQRPVFAGAHNHPWSVIAKVIQFQPNKPISVSLSALSWLSGLLEKPDAFKAFESHGPVLRTVLQPCFARFVEFNEREGRTFRWWTQPVHIENTQPVRDQALAILHQVIDHGSWPVVLDALSALEPAVERSIPSDAERVEDPEQFRLRWRPERQKALGLYEFALSRHAHVAVRFEIRQALRRNLAYEEDPVFAGDCRRVLAMIREDLSLRVTTELLPHGFFELDEEAATPEERHEKADELWQKRLRETAAELAQTHATAEVLLDFLQGLGAELQRAGHHPQFGPLLGELVKADPSVAVRLAERILESGAETPVAREIPVLVDQNAVLSDPERSSLLAKAARSSIPGVAPAVVNFIAWRAVRTSAPPSVEEAELLLELAARADADIAHRLLDFCKNAADPSLPVVCRILEALPLAGLPSASVGAVWEVLVPYRKRPTPLPRHIVTHVLQQLVSAPRLDLHNHGQQFHELAETAPRDVYELLHARVLCAASPTPPKGYAPLPEGYHFALRLPALARDSDYPAICAELWQRVLTRDERGRYHWQELWRAVVLVDTPAWLPRLQQEVLAAQTPDDLERLTELLQFDGSLIVFRFPELTRSFLARAQILGGEVLLTEIRARLRASPGPTVRSYTNGVLDPEDDFVEAEALKAAETHASDPLLGPFYRRIVEVEQNHRVGHKARSEAEMAALD